METSAGRYRKESTGGEEKRPGPDTDAQFWDQTQGKFVTKPLTGTSFGERKQTPKGLAKRDALAMLEELLDAVERKDCEDKARYDTLELLCYYASGRQNMANAAKFILGIT